MSDRNDRREKGKALARRILKDGPPPFRVPKKFQKYTLENVFGDLWQDEDLELWERSLVTCTILVALNREGEQRIHLKAAKELGVPRRKLEAMIIHAAHYAGWPVAASAFRNLDEVWPEEDGG
tara:strand:+ start:273 stop:641 length:369 start_codon:yes stop_codon:yes gene_type:complete